MILQVEFSWLVGLMLAFFGVVWAFGKVLMAQFEKRLSERFAAIEEARKNAGAVLQQELAQLKNMERDFLKFQAELPTRVVFRDDYIRGQSVLEAKQDALFGKMELVRIEVAQMKGVIHD